MLPEKANNNNIISIDNQNNTIKRFSGYTRANSQSSAKKIPRPNKSKISLNNSNCSNSNTKSNSILTSIQDNINSNFLVDNEKDDEHSKIYILKKNYDNRLGNLLLNFQKTINNLTNENAKELINEVIFMEKEKLISDLYEQNAIIKNEYEENKNEMNRLQKIISVLELDLHKTQKKLDEKNAEIIRLNESLTQQQAENFDLNLKIKGLMEQMEQDKHNNINVNLSKDFNFSIGNYAQFDAGMGTADRSVLQLTEELNKLKDNKVENMENNDNSSALNSNSNNNILINKYEEMINNLKNNHKEEINNLIKENEIKIEQIKEEMNSQINEMKEINQKNEIKIKKYQNDIDINLSEISGLGNKLKLNEQIIILLRSKISSIKSEMKTLQKYIKDEFNIYNKENQSIVNNINQTIYNHFHSNLTNSFENSGIINNDENIQELYDQLKIYEIENKQLYNNQKEYIDNIKSLSKKCEAYEKENRNLIGQINKLNMENQLLNQSFNTIKNCNKLECSIIKNYNKIVKKKIEAMRNKYTQSIGELKTMISVLMCGMKKYNSIVLKYSNNKSNEQKKTKLIEEMQKKINGMKINQEEYIKAINKKNKKIKELQDALNRSLMSYNSGVNSIKIANLLDNEVKEFLKKSKETNDTENNNE